MNLIFCGLPKSGKTTLGKMVAKKLKRRFVDTDRLIEAAYTKETGLSRSCRDIYRFEGENVFRQREKEQISLLTPLKNHVISLGGGALSIPENREALRSIGYFIYLHTSLEILWGRICRSGTPAYLDPDDPKKSFFELNEKRMSVYKEVAHSIIETDGHSFADIMDLIIQHNYLPQSKD